MPCLRTMVVAPSQIQEGGAVSKRVCDMRHSTGADPGGDRGIPRCTPMDTFNISRLVFFKGNRIHYPVVRIMPFKVTVREGLAGYVDASDRGVGIHGSPGRLNICPKYQYKHIRKSNGVRRLRFDLMATVMTGVAFGTASLHGGAVLAEARRVVVADSGADPSGRGDSYGESTPFRHDPPMGTSILCARGIDVEWRL